MKSLTARKYTVKDRSRGRGQTLMVSVVTQLDAVFLPLYGMDLDPRVYVIA
jgi:hypothetical protein